MAELVTPSDLAAFLRRKVDPESGTVACRMASGWLRGATALTSWPDPVPDDLWGWALELAALVYSNPQGADRVVLGRISTGWSGRARVEEILAKAKAAYATGTVAGAPLGSFPDAKAWPDSAELIWTSTE